MRDWRNEAGLQAGVYPWAGDLLEEGQGGEALSLSSGNGGERSSRRQQL